MSAHQSKWRNRWSCDPTRLVATHENGFTVSAVVNPDGSISLATKGLQIPKPPAAGDASWIVGAGRDLGRLLQEGARLLLEILLGRTA